MSNKYGPSSSISRQQVFWIAGGIAVGLGGFALYYQRKKVLILPLLTTSLLGASTWKPQPMCS